ncbi:MAG: hypothetical protein ABI268_13425 [Rhodanobacter sp.]
MIIAVVMSMALWFGMRVMPMVQTLDPVSLASGPIYNEIIYHAVHGRWPSAGDPTIVAGSNKSTYVKNFTLDGNGVVTAHVALGAIPGFGSASSAAAANTIHGSLSFRPELLGSRDAPTVTFLCGYAQPVADPVATIGSNRTTLDKRVLPPFCR